MEAALLLLGKLILLGYLASLPANAAPNAAINSWVQQAKANPAYKKAVFPRKIVLIDEIVSQQTPTFMELDVSNFNMLSFVATIPRNDARQTLQINDPPKSGSDEESRIYSALTLLGSDLMIIGKYDGKPWRIVGLYKNKPIVIAKSPAPQGGGTNQNALVKWLLRNLGYDAVVIGVNKDRILVGGRADQLTANIKGVVLRRSADTLKMAMPPEESLVSIQKVSSEGAFAEFRIINNDANDEEDTENAGTKTLVPVGSKVIFPDVH